MLKGTTQSGFAFEIPDARCRCLPVHCKKPCRLVSDAGVDRLIFRFEGNKQTLAFLFYHQAHPAMSPPKIRIHCRADRICRTGKFRRPISDNCRSRRIRIIVHHRHIFFQDSRLFARDLCHRAAQVFHMVKADRSDNRKRWMLDAVRCIQPSAKPRFQNHILRLFPAHHPHEHQKQIFKIRRTPQSFLLKMNI